MRLTKAPSADKGVALAAILAGLAIAGLLSVACSSSSTPEQPLESGEPPQTIELLEAQAGNTLSAEELPPNAAQVHTEKGGHSTLKVASPDHPATPVNAGQATGDRTVYGVSGQQQTGSNVQESKQVPLPGNEPQPWPSDTGDASTPILEQDSFPLSSDSLEATPGSPITASDVPKGNRGAPLDEAGELVVLKDGTTGALGPGQELKGNDDDVTGMNLPVKKTKKYPNLGSHLNRLVASVEEGQTTAEKAALGAAIYIDESIAVTIYLSAQVDEVVTFLENNGGDPRNVGVDHIEAYVPVTLLGPVSELAGVTRVREIVPPRKGQAPPVSIP